MADPFIGEIKIFSFSFAPRGWALCDGQTLAIAQNQALFALFGTFYGGDGRTNFKLPNLNGRVPVHFAPAIPIGSAGGEVTHALTIQEIPQHTHSLSGVKAAATTGNPSGASFGQPSTAIGNAYAVTRNAPAVMNAAALANVGNGAAHQNMQPYLTLAFCVALQGIFPSRN